MSQYDFGNLSSPLAGSVFIDTHLEPWRNALHSMHSGTSRPSYAVAGTMWLDTTTTPWVVKVFDGTDDISIGTINATTNVFTPSGSYVPFTAASASGAASIQLAEDTDNGTNKVTVQAPASLTSDATVELPSHAGTILANTLTTVTASGTSVDFTGIPATARYIAIAVSGLSASSTGEIIVQLGNSGGVETTGYLGAAGTLAYSSGFRSGYAAAANLLHGIFTFQLVSASSNTWAGTSMIALSNTNSSLGGGGSKALSATLDRVRVTTSSGTDTFDAGTISCIYW